MAVLSKKQMSEEDIKLNFITPSKDDLLITCIGGSIGWSWIVDESKFYYKDGNVVAFDKNNFIYLKFLKTLYLIFDYPYKYYTFKHFEV